MHLPNKIQALWVGQFQHFGDGGFTVYGFLV